MRMTNHPPTPALRREGALLGTVVGDALGRPFEGTPSPDRALVAGLAQRIASPRAWGHSDDGEMMLAVAESLAGCGAVDEAHLLATLAERHDPARGYGRGSRAAFRAWRAGASWRDAARACWEDGSRGNGASVRVAPVALLAEHLDEARVAELARRSADPTHAHAEGRDGAAVIAVAVHRALRGLMPSQLIVGLGAFASGRFAERVDAVDPSMSSGAAGRALGTGVLAIESVPAALWAVAGATSFVDAVTRAVGLGGDTDSIGAMAGAIAGATHGAGGIPASWLAALENGIASRTRALADRIASVAAIG